MDDIFNSEVIHKHAIDFFDSRRAGRFRTTDNLQNSFHPAGGLFGKGGVKKIQLPVEVVLNGASNLFLFVFGDVGIPQRGYNPLTGLSFLVAIGFDELDQRRVFNSFGAKIHMGTVQDTASKKIKKKWYY